MSCQGSTFHSVTIKDYLRGLSSLITEEGLETVLIKRRLSGLLPVRDLTERDLDLAEAEVYFWLSNLPVGGGTTKDVDGSWSHTEGGWNVSGENIREWRKKYTDLREKWNETVTTKSKMRIINF